jgi:hypothetical protein
MDSGDGRHSSKQPTVSSSAMLRTVYLVVGTLMVVLGGIGLLLPIVPTTPFLLVAAACYARGSKRFYYWLLRQPYFGKYIRAWREEGRIPRRGKITAIFMIALTVGISIAVFIPFPAVKILAAGIAIAVMVYISRCPD